MGRLERLGSREEEEGEKAGVERVEGGADLGRINLNFPHPRQKTGVPILHLFVVAIAQLLVDRDTCVKSGVVFTADRRARATPPALVCRRACAKYSLLAAHSSDNRSRTTGHRPAGPPACGHSSWDVTRLPPACPTY